MCGILVQQVGKKSCIDASIFKQHLNRLEHRGPDAKQLWIDPKGRYAFGHTRLSIVGLNNGTQPFVKKDGRLVCAVNGELYNYRKIRERLIAGGHQFESDSDSEIVVELYRAYGLDMMQHLRGEFAFVLYDEDKNRWVAGRDRFGIKPLYLYSKRDQGFVISSEAKAILGLGSVPRRLNQEAVLFADHYIPMEDHSYFSEIKAIKPGHIWIYEDEQEQEFCYWDNNYCTPPAGISDEDYIGKFRQLLENAIHLRLHGDVPVAYYLSGGLDSSAIVALASKHLAHRGEAFGIRFLDHDYDESHLARKVAEHCGVPFHPIDIGEKDLADNYVAAVLQNEGAIYNAQTVAKFCLSKLVRRHGIKVVLTGEGADEALAGYPFFREDVLAAEGAKPEAIAALHQANSVVGHAFLSSEIDNPLLKVVPKILGYLPTMWKVGARYGQIYRNRYYKEDFVNQFAKFNPFEQLAQRYAGRLKDLDPLQSSLYLWSKTNLCQVILSFLSDRMEMAHSVEGRLPFLDHPLVEFCQSLPPHLWINQQQEKYILRKAVQNELPEEIVQRSKFPFSAPPILASYEEPTGPLEILARDLLASKSYETSCYDSHKVLEEMDRLKKAPKKDRAAFDQVLNRVLSTAILKKEYALEG